jgi:hypothetical protein
MNVLIIIVRILLAWYGAGTGTVPVPVPIISTRVTVLCTVSHCFCKPQIHHHIIQKLNVNEINVRRQRQRARRLPRALLRLSKIAFSLVTCPRCRRVRLSPLPRRSTALARSRMSPPSLSTASTSTLDGFTCSLAQTGTENNVKQA